ncbi:Concanavalin a-like lectin glucanase [Rhizoctonia solani]|uniref:Concanavalin a-like lectin glucanase n=1 Tax=Rhizoctonia solani TaxID=456999 RepID=A0A8H7IGA6_9AGAM|nr:Concanavalin a-like lectin glucanase [Rhizoctonia solani]
MVRTLLLAPFSIAVASAATLTERQANTRACGYKDSTGAVWFRESIVSDFTAGSESVLSQNYYKFTWQEDHENVPYGMQYTANNVYAYNDGLGSKLPHILAVSRLVESAPPAAIFFTDHIRMATNIGVEFLSSDVDYYQRVHQTNQPGLINDNTDLSACKAVVIPGADFTAFHEHRLDWLPGSTKYYYDGSLKSTVSKNSPAVASSILANV